MLGYNNRNLVDKQHHDKYFLKMKNIKKSISSKLVSNYKLDTTKIYTHIPKAGDVAIFEVIKIGTHTTLQGVNANNIYLFEGDKFMGAFGNRYATQVFEGIVPNQVQEYYDMLGKGGVVGKVRTANAKTLLKGVTTLKLVGYATDPQSGEVLNTIRISKQQQYTNGYHPLNSKIILSIGSTMDSGKTTTAGYLCGGLRKAGYQAAYIKLTGTVFAKDCAFAKSRGAEIAIDFSLLGYPSTYLCSLTELTEIYDRLLREVQKVCHPDFIVIEIADGLLQRETNMLLKDQLFMSNIDGVIYSAGDSLSVLGGLQTLKAMEIKPFAISGCFTISPMLVEEIQPLLDIPILDLEGLLNINPDLIPQNTVPLFSDAVSFIAKNARLIHAQ